MRLVKMITRFLAHHLAIPLPPPRDAAWEEQQRREAAARVRAIQARVAVVKTRASRQDAK